MLFDTVMLYCYSYYEEGGFSTLAVDNMQVDMGEILSRVIRKRRLQIHDSCVCVCVGGGVLYVL